MYLGLYQKKSVFESQIGQKQYSVNGATPQTKQTKKHTCIHTYKNKTKKHIDNRRNQICKPHQLKTSNIL